ncbi:type III pantothenate kinase [Alteribacter aurantiacus]|uniref:type III pantothenate kinase n=1 Tax=Alteribacter aurantiacus TaxID=254410 RepID=UPI00041808FC|nr:type III pantothenate kinase [Alteribacter aurantiacus]
MILVLDVGNTNVALGVYDGNKLVHHWRIGTDFRKTSDEYGVLLGSLFSQVGIHYKDIQGAMMSSVVPSVMYALIQMCKDYLKVEPNVVGPGIKTGLNIRYDNPKEVGSDRIANAVGGIKEYQSPLIIVDFGTATTFCYINEHAQYEGGTITPGIKISTEALYTHGSKLPRVELNKPNGIIGKNTVHAMQAGIIYGYVGQVEKIVEEIKKQAKMNPHVIATGGLCKLIAYETPVIDQVDPLLSLKGLKEIYEKNNTH